MSAILDHAPGNGVPIGGIKIVAQDCWLAARPSGTENICKPYAGTFGGEGLLAQVQADGRALIASVFAAE
jgi:phosphoglucomutase